MDSCHESLGDLPNGFYRDFGPPIEGGNGGKSSGGEEIRCSSHFNPKHQKTPNPAQILRENENKLGEWIAYELMIAMIPHTHLKSLS